MNQHSAIISQPIVIVSIKEVQNIFSPPICKSKAHRMIQLFKDANPKPKHQLYTMNEFCEHIGIKKNEWLNL